MTLNNIFTERNIAAFTLVFMSVQFIYIEGMAISIPKVVFMAITPILLLIKSPKFSKAALLGFLFLGVTVLINRALYPSTKTSTFYYTALFLCMFWLYYNLVYVNHAISIDFFLQLIKVVIYAYAVCLLLQQIFYFFGVSYIPIINLMGFPYYSSFKFNTLAIEPSHAARILTVYFYAFLKLLEYQNGSSVSIPQLWRNHKFVIIAFLYTMLLMGSGTAFVGLALLSLYFLKLKYVVWVVVLGFSIYMIIPLIDYEPLNRAVAVFNTALLGDTEEMKIVDNSASSRVNIIIDTFKYLDVTDINLWFGYGVDFKDGKSIIPAITNYGLISYFLKLIFFFSCCFTGFFSLEVLFFILLLGMNVGNIAYGWAILMVFTTLKYFKIQSNYYWKNLRSENKYENVI